jgi:hypothetical protein
VRDEYSTWTGVFFVEVAVVVESFDPVVTGHEKPADWVVE